MNWQRELQSAVSEAASNPKLTGAISTATASLGVASFTDLITGALAVLATVAGTVVTILLGRVHLASYRTQQLQNKLLRQQLISMGGDPDKDDE
jgi:hypothetical protein